ncbi:MAG: hypothetical protein CL760_02465 [Chloroflexi bacterium]|nr:hypothetical protein [Chloroflexota bacterium]MQG05609.1 hypothetical protein [SAR202 cluster bacterium]|tara:strand:- start:13559 stop:14200 length:642 start_codon:yes stop_codon:yes gene_type:complete
MNSNKIIAWMLIIGPIVTFITGFLASILIGQANTPTEAVQEIMDNQNLTTILTVVNSLGFVSALVGATLLSKTMSGEDKPGGIVAQISTVLFIGLVTLAIVGSLSDLATVGAIQSKATDAAINFSNAVTIQIVGGVLWNGLFFYWGVAFIIFGIAALIQKRLHLIVDWVFVVFGTIFLILSIAPIDLGQAIFIVFGLMVVNTIVGGVFLLKGK